MGRWLIAAGIVLVVIGTILHFAPWMISWFGRLPGDVRIETERTRVSIPLVSMILISIVLTVLVNLFKR